MDKQDKGKVETSSPAKKVIPISDRLKDNESKKREVIVAKLIKYAESLGW